MCGIAGFIDFSQRSGEEVLRSMTDALQHRGPNDAGYKVVQHPSCTVGLGHRRLSILDLSSSGHQPMVFGSLSIIFNGEIYNYKEIRKELEDHGYTFSSGGDTEVLLKGYDLWQEKVIDKCIGMFAFAILDEAREELVLVRDRAGVKPLYYYWQNNTLLFASELKSFHQHPNFQKEIDVNSLSLFLQYSYIPGPYSIFRNTWKLKPGHLLRMPLKGGDPSLECYWSVLNAYQQPLVNDREEEVLRKTEALLQSAYKYRMVSDVPVGVFLSGGYDSTSVAAILQSGTASRIKTFTIGYKEQAFDESAEARKIAMHLGTDHHEWIVGPSDALSVLHKLPEIYDEPFADNSTVPTTLVSMLAGKQVKVALGGDGGDELFAGYNKFNQSISYTSKMPRAVQVMASAAMGLVNPENIPYFKNKYNFATRFEKMKLIWQSGKPELAMKYISQYVTESEADHYMGVPVERYKTNFDLNGDLAKVNGKLNRLLAVDYTTFLVDNNLVKMDRATMSVSIEGREPMLDHRLVEYLARVPDALKTKDGVNKYLLKSIVHKYVPRSMMERPKKPFIAPLTIWFKDELKAQMDHYLSASNLNSTGLINGENVQELLKRYQQGEKVSHQKLWNILVFQLWYERWMK